MGNGGVSALFPDNDGGGGDDPAPSFAYTEIFKKVFPYYLSIGMTYEQFWYGDVELVKFYREAWRLRQQQENQRLWLQGLYVYEAVLDASPVLHAFAQKGTKPIPYRDQPHELFGKRSAGQKRISQEQKSDNKAKAMMEIFMVNFNRRFEKDGEGNGG